MAAPAAGFPWLPALSLAAGPLLQSILPKQFGGQSSFQGFDPEQYRDELTIDEGELSGMRQGILSGIRQSIVEPGIRSVKQAGAAKRLPLGSVASATRGVASAGAKKAAEAEPGLQNLKRKSMLDFLNLKSEYESEKGLYDFAQNQQSASMLQGSLGGLSRLLMLWQSGALDRPPVPELETG